MGVSLNHRSIQPVNNYTFHLAKKRKDEEVKAPNLYHIQRVCLKKKNG